MQTITHSDTEDTSDNKNAMYYLYKISHNPFPNIKFNNTPTKEMERIMKSIRVKNLHGYDGITTEMLKVSALYINSPLNYIYIFGTFPTRLKYSIVKPLFKKGDTEKMAHFRPISLLTSFSVVFEKKSYMKDFSNILTLITF
jgi:hypothetical protein